MYRPNRREFLAGVAGLGLLPLEQSEAELGLVNGNIITVDDNQPKAQAVAIVRDRLFAVGSNEDVLNLATARTKRVDLEGKTVVPGFVDPVSGRYDLEPGSQLIDSGLLIRGINDRFSGSAPDIGARERIKGSSQFGKWRVY